MTRSNKSVFKTEIITSLETLPLSKKGMFAFKLETRYPKNFGLHGRKKNSEPSTDETIASIQGITNEKSIKEFNDGKRNSVPALNIVLTSNKLLKEGARVKGLDLNDDKATAKTYDALKSGRRTEEHLLTYNPDTDEYSSFKTGALACRPIQLHCPVFCNDEEYDLNKAKSVIETWASLHGYELKANIESIPYYLEMSANRALEITLYPSPEQMADFTAKKKSPEDILETMIKKELVSAKKPRVKIAAVRNWDPSQND